MRKQISNLVMCIILCVLPIIAYGQTPQLRTFPLPSSSIVNMSDNGLWAVAHGNNGSDEEDYPYLINVTTNEAKSLISTSDSEKGISGALHDATDDGMGVGIYKGQPASYKDGKWTTYSTPKNRAACIYSITPDGKYMVGYSEPWSEGDNYREEPYLWVDGVYTECPGLPTTGFGGQKLLMNRFLAISADGRYILGFLNFSYLMDGVGGYIYDRTTQTYELLGKGFLNDSEYITQVAMSPNGEWISGTMILVDEKRPNGEYVPFLYNVKTKEFKKFDDEESYDIGVFAVANDGTMMGCSPFVNPIRTLKYRVGNFWYGLDTMLKERYGIDYQAMTGYESTGVAAAVSADCKTIAGMSILYKNYVISLPETYAEAAKGVNLLSNYTITPEAGSTFHKASTFILTFDRQAKLLDNAAKKIKLYDGDTAIATAISVKMSSTSTKSFQIGFIPKTLENGKVYTLKIESGCFGIDGSDNVNKEITASYVGRDEQPVKPLSYSMADGSEQGELSYMQNLAIKFDIPLTLVENKVGYLYQGDSTEPVCELQLAVSGAYLAAYPKITQHLYLGSQYKVVIPANTVTDSQGACGNEEIVLHYKGIYKKELPTPGATLLDEDFNNPATSYNYFMLYDGDKLEPSGAMASMQFDATNTPWNFTIRENEASNDFCAGAHSMFDKTPGTSNDWMSTVQLQIPTKKYVLTFDSQSYKKNCSDRLKVYVLQTDDEYDYLDATAVDRIEKEGDLVYDNIETPGEDEELLTGDWKHNRIPLDKYAGKSIYIAFLNRNTDQSMLFVDNIKVAFDGTFSIGNETDASVVNKKDADVKGFVEIITTNEEARFHAVDVSLLDAQNNVIDTKNYTGLNLKKGDRLEFAFDKKLALEIGKTNNYSIKASIDDDEVVLNASIKNLSFVPEKKVVIEEGTGLWCGNCPDGIVAIEHLANSYPNNFIPIAVHSNSGGADLFNFSAYISQLGINAFPMGRINRSKSAYSPLAYDLDTQKVSFTSATGDQSFTDIFLKEIEKQSEIGIKVTSATYDKALNKIEVKADVTSALNMESANYRLFSVVLEDGLMGVQSNYRYAEKDPIFGDWGADGKYNKSANVVTNNHVARAMLSNSIDGVSGIIPSSLEASVACPIQITQTMPTTVSNMANASVVCMVINANTGAILNADQLKFADASGVSLVGNENSDVVVYPQDEYAVVKFANNTNATIELYNANGLMINKVTTDVVAGDMVRVDSKGTKGLLLVKVTTDSNSVVEKIMMK